MGQTSRASVRRWSTTRHKSSTGVPSSVHYQLNICFSRANSSATAALESSIPVPAQASEKPRHPAAAAAAAAAHHHHLCPYGSSLSLGRLQKRMQIAGASSGTGRGWAVSTPSYEALAARKCSLHLPWSNRILPRTSFCRDNTVPFREGEPTALLHLPRSDLTLPRTSFAETTRCYSGRENPLPRCTFHGGIAQHMVPSREGAHTSSLHFHGEIEHLVPSREGGHHGSVPNLTNACCQSPL
ncbi:hypothetical protein E2C01_011658 [Portunus trituberculatus]|uniref:Uncharacterized protein n=1 Tax=Portunus trituberculatus TaxID=210409 RepID=A0A5B7DCJ1_PORTR|nr:hypothetical protein [Portunus trituberculatus]